MTTFSISKRQNYISDFEKSGNLQIENDFFSQLVTYNSYSSRLSNDERDKIIEALCLFSLKKNDLSENIYKKLVNSSSSSGLINYLRGYNLEYLEKYNLALNCYISATNEDKFPFESYLRMGIVYNDLEKYNNAIHSLNIFMKNNDTIKLAFRARGISYLKALNYDSAIYDFNKFIKLDSSDLDIYYDRAYCLKNLEKYEDAIKDYSHIIKYKTRDIELQCLIAECWYLSGDTTSAFTLLNQTYKEFHILTETGNITLGSINLLYKNYDSAIADFSRVIKNNVNNIEAFTFRGLTYYCKEEYKNAKDDFTKALNLNKNEITALYTRGLVNIKLKKLDEAYLDLKKADSLGHPLAKKALNTYLKDFKPNNNDLF
jgi:tetratricopeptide (TPR) repeat protein